MFRKRKNRPKHRATTPSRPVTAVDVGRPSIESVHQRIITQAAEKPERIPWSSRDSSDIELSSLSIHQQIITLKSKIRTITDDERTMMEALSTAVVIATRRRYRNFFSKHRYSKVTEALVAVHAVFADLQLGMNTRSNDLVKHCERLEDEIARRVANGETIMQIAQDVPVADDRPRPTVATGNETGTEVTVSFVNVRRPSPSPVETSDTPDDTDTDDTSEESSSESHDAHDQ